MWLLAGPIKSNWPNVRTWSVFQYPVTNGVPVPESNPIMITVSAVINNFLLECVAQFQSNTEASTSYDVHYHFGGAAICDMLHLRYEQIKSCKDEQRDVLSQEISVVQAMNTKDKTKIPGHLQYGIVDTCTFLIHASCHVLKK